MFGTDLLIELVFGESFPMCRDGDVGIFQTIGEIDILSLEGDDASDLGEVDFLEREDLLHISVDDRFQRNIQRIQYKSGHRNRLASIVGDRK